MRYVLAKEPRLLLSKERILQGIYIDAQIVEWVTDRRIQNDLLAARCASLLSLAQSG